MVASCTIRVQDSVQKPEPDPLNGELDMILVQEITADDAYNQLGRHGYEYDKEFRTLTGVTLDRTKARIRPTQGRNSSGMKSFILTLDAMLQLLVLNHLGWSQFGACFLPVRIKKVKLFGQPPSVDGCVASVSQSMGYSVQVDTFSTLTLVELQKGALSEVSPNFKLNKLCLKPVPSGPTDSDTGHLGHDYKHMNVHILSGQFNFEQWRSQVLQLQNNSPRFTDHITNTSHTLLVSCAPFSGFLRSLQQEPGFEHLRGLQVILILIIISKR